MSLHEARLEIAQQQTRRPRRVEPRKQILKDLAVLGIGVSLLLLFAWFAASV